MQRTSEEVELPGWVCSKKNVIAHVKFPDKVELLPMEKPLPIPVEDFFPASYLFKPCNYEEFEENIRRQLDKQLQVQAAWPVADSQYVQNRTRIDENGVLRRPREIQGNFIPFGPVMRPVNPGKSLECAPFDDFYLPLGYLINRVTNSTRYQAPKLSVQPDLRVKRRAPPRTRKSRPEDLSPFFPLSQYHNRFFYARAMIHPYLETYSFEDVGKIMSALWNDSKASSASDYFTFLTMTTFIDPQAIQSQLSHLQIWDYEGTKVIPRDLRSEIGEIIQKKREEVDLLLQNQGLPTPPARPNPLQMTWAQRRDARLQAFHQWQLVNSACPGDEYKHDYSQDEYKQDDYKQDE